MRKETNEGFCNNLALLKRLSTSTIALIFSTFSLPIVDHQKTSQLVSVIVERPTHYPCAAEACSNLCCITTKLSTLLSLYSRLKSYYKAKELIRPAPVGQMWLHFSLAIIG